MALSLKDIKASIQGELDKFDVHFRESMKSKSKVPLLDKITYYIVKSKGKQVRPMFVFLAAKAVGEVSEATYIAASQIELLHTATLVHDDVVDDSYERRGFFSINALWKNKIAVLVGDFLLAKGFIMSLKHDQFELLKILSNAVEAMSEGELLQIEKARKLDIQEDVYYDIIEKKTASLIEAACSAGAASVTDSKEHIEILKDFGRNTGICFQIKDDLFDYGSDDIGKPLGIDIKEKKMTLPLIYALSQATWLEKRKIIRYIKNDSNNKKKVAEVIQFVKDKGGMEYTEQKMKEYYQKSLSILHKLPQSDARDKLEDLLTFVITRKK